jgi:Fe2+ or Zn2+ uptake regulation protein
VNFAERIAQDRRLSILRLLERTPGYRVNESLLHLALEDLGHRTSHDQLRAELGWLAEQGLVALEEIAGVLIATATERGVDVAQGKAIVPGVKRPAPGR